MKKILLVIFVGISSLVFSMDRFQTDAEKNHDDLLKIYKNLEEICVCLNQLTEQNTEILNLSRQTNDLLQQLGAETWEPFHPSYPAD